MSRHACQFESMECRRMMSYSLANSVLTVFGGAGNDRVTLSQDMLFVRLNDNGVVTSFLQAAVQSVVAHLHGGNDSFDAAGLSRPVTVHGGRGNDWVRGGNANDVLTGGGETDSLFGGAGNDVLDGGVGGVAIFGDNTGNDFLTGGDGNDILHASDFGNNSLFGDFGDDFLAGYDGNDYLSGGFGNDHMSGWRGNDTLLGGFGNDAMQGGGGNDSLDGGFGNDLVDGGNHGAGSFADNSGFDTVRGGDGDDVVHAADFGSNRLYGDAGNDAVFGYFGNDSLYGGAGNDSMNGGAGNDVLVSIDGAGLNDQLTGGPGTDQFWGDRTRLGVFAFADRVIDADAYESARATRMVSSFRNGADTSLDGDNIADPADSGTQQNYRNNPLFAPSGPSIRDMDQNTLGNCGLISALGAVANTRPDYVRNAIADLGDGTYGVRLGGDYYRVDADLPVSGSTLWAAGLGRENSTWMALLNKVYAFRRSNGTNHNYSSLNNGWGGQEVLGDLHQGAGAWRWRGSAAAAGTGETGATFLSELYSHWRSGRSMILGFQAVPNGSPVVGAHVYAVERVNTVTIFGITIPVSVVIRNPWGDHTAASQTITADTLFNTQCWMGWSTT